MKAYTYMVRCADGTLYTGWTNNVEKRIAAHNSGHGAKYTRARGPVVLVWSEAFLTKQEAQAREYEIKQWRRSKKEQLCIEKSTFAIKQINNKMRRGIALYYFTSDYTEGCHPAILKKLEETNMEQTIGYGLDPYSLEAQRLIIEQCGRSDVDVHLCIGGTQTNLTIICAALRPFQGVYAAITSHINTHEAGAIERTGHKVLELPTPDGKLTAEQVDKAYQVYDTDPNREHWVQPKMVYISQPTEIGSLYHKDELTAIYTVCQKYGLYLFIDGARMGYGLCAPDNDLTIAAMAQLCDVFYIGGTKIGAMFGEAVVIINPELKDDFRSIMKQGGAILAKGRLLGIQFQTLFTDNLYVEISQHAIDMAMKIKKALQDKQLPLLTDSTTNQQFVTISREAYKKISQQFVLDEIRLLGDGQITVRICTSWATDELQVNQLIKLIHSL